MDPSKTEEEKEVRVGIFWRQETLASGDQSHRSYCPNHCPHCVSSQPHLETIA